MHSKMTATTGRNRRLDPGRARRIPAGARPVTRQHMAIVEILLAHPHRHVSAEISMTRCAGREHPDR